MPYFIPRGLGGSDAYSFQEKGIPALFAHTTQSQPYNHHPLDDVELINPKALENVTKFMLQAIKTVEEDRNFFVALKLKGLNSFNQDLTLLEILHGLGVRMVSLDCTDVTSPELTKMFTRAGDLSNWGKEFLAKMNQLGMILELESPSVDHFNKILSFSKQPLVISAPDMDKSSVSKFLRSAQSGKIFFSLNYNTKSVGEFSKLTEVLEILINKDLVRCFVLNPYGYYEDGSYTQLTISLFKNGYDEETIIKILGSNFVELFSEICKN